MQRATPEDLTDIYSVATEYIALGHHYLHYPIEHNNAVFFYSDYLARVLKTYVDYFAEEGIYSVDNQRAVIKADHFCKFIAKTSALMTKAAKKMAAMKNEDGCAETAVILMVQEKLISERIKLSVFGSPKSVTESESTKNRLDSGGSSNYTRN